MVNWIIFAIGSGLLIGTYNLFLESTKKLLDSDIISKLIYINVILIFASLFSLILLIVYYLRNRNTFKNFIQNIISKKIIYCLIPAIVLLTYMSFNVLALSKVGGIAIFIFNSLASFLTLFGGVILFKDKINSKVVISLIIGLSFIIYASLQSNKINKN